MHVLKSLTLRMRRERAEFQECFSSLRKLEIAKCATLCSVGPCRTNCDSAVKHLSSRHRVNAPLRSQLPLLARLTVTVLVLKRLLEIYTEGAKITSQVFLCLLEEKNINRHKYLLGFFFAGKSDQHFSAWWFYLRPEGQFRVQHHQLTAAEKVRNVRKGKQSPGAGQRPPSVRLQPNEVHQVEGSAS